MSQKTGCYHSILDYTGLCYTIRRYHILSCTITYYKRTIVYYHVLSNIV